MVRVDFYVPSNVFLNGPTILRRTPEGFTWTYLASHDGYVWAIVVPAENAGGVTIPLIKLNYGAHGAETCQLSKKPIASGVTETETFTNCNLTIGVGYRLFAYVRGTPDK